MSYEAIYAAAKDLDLIKLKQALSITCIDEWKPGVYCFSAVSQLALENNKAAVNFLVMHGASINYVAIGAALGGNLNLAKSLLKAGADVKWVAYAAVLGGHIEFAKTLLAIDEKVITFIAGAAARMGDRKLLMALLQSYPGDNAIIDKKFICVNAGISGNRELCDALLSNEIFPNFNTINPVALGAGFGGHEVFCERIVTKCHTNLYYYPLMYIAAGAAMSGNKAYAERLLQHLKDNVDQRSGLRIMLEYTAQAGRRAYAEELYKRHEELLEFYWRALGRGDLDKASPYDLHHLLFRGAITGNHPLYVGEILSAKIDHRKNPFIEEEKALFILDQLSLTQQCANRTSYSLSSYHFKFITNLLEELKYSIAPVTKNIEATILKRCLSISRLRYNNTSPLSYLMALVLTDKTSHGMLFLLMKLFVAKTRATPFKAMPNEILLYIFDFIIPIQLDGEDLKHLAFMVARAYLMAQLSFYHSKDNAAHKERAHSFREAIQSTKNKRELVLLVDQQVQVLQGHNPYWFFQRNKTYKESIACAAVDKYYSILGFWKKEMKGEEVGFESSIRKSFKFIQM